jgi:hypothetical protein
MKGDCIRLGKRAHASFEVIYGVWVYRHGLGQVMFQDLV